MVPRLNEFLNISEDRLKAAGVFNAFIGVDSLLFLDPHLLENTTIPEFKQSYKKLKTYYQEILTLLSASENTSDRAWKVAFKRLIFRELPGVAIGYGKKNNNGSGVGPGLAGRLISSADQIIRMGIREPAIFELLGLFEEGFGADRISDMTIRIIQEDILAYTQRVANEFGVKIPIKINIRDKVYCAPDSGIPKKPLLFLPYEFLRELPVALSWEDISKVTNLNEELRSRLNALIASVWGNAEKPTKAEIKNFLLKNPRDLAVLLEAYKKTPARHYDIDTDPSGHLKWSKIGKEFALANKLNLSLPANPTLEQVESIVVQIINQFKRNIEVNNLKQHLYRKQATLLQPLHEKYAQLLFYAAADTYCRANNLDLSAEPNAGNGPVDFKVSSGYNSKVLVEIKLTSNKNLLAGLTEQLGAYQQSENSESSMYVVVQVTSTSDSIKKLIKYRDALVNEGKKVPKLFIVDATIKPSGSKRRLII